MRRTLDVMKGPSSYVGYQNLRVQQGFVIPGIRHRQGQSLIDVIMQICVAFQCWINGSTN